MNMVSLISSGFITFPSHSEENTVWKAAAFVWAHLGCMCHYSYKTYTFAYSLGKKTKHIYLEQYLGYSVFYIFTPSMPYLIVSTPAYISRKNLQPRTEQFCKYHNFFMLWWLLKESIYKHKLAFKTLILIFSCDAEQVYICPNSNCPSSLQGAVQNLTEGSGGNWYRSQMQKRNLIFTIRIIE